MRLTFIFNEAHKGSVVGNNPGTVRMYEVVTPPSIFFKSITFQRSLCVQGMHSRGVWNASLCDLAGTQGQQTLEPGTKAQAVLQVIEQMPNVLLKTILVPINIIF